MYYYPLRIVEKNNINKEIEDFKSSRFLHESNDDEVQVFLRKHHGESQLYCGCRHYNHKYDTRLSIKSKNNNYFWSCIKSPEEHTEDCPFRRNNNCLPSIYKKDDLTIYKVSGRRDKKEADDSKKSKKTMVKKPEENDRSKARKKSSRNLFGAMTHINMECWARYSLGKHYRKMPFESYLLTRFKSIALSKIKIDGKVISINEAMFTHKKFFYGRIKTVTELKRNVKIETTQRMFFYVKKKAYEAALERYGFIINDIYDITGYTLCGYLEDHEYKNQRNELIKTKQLKEFIVMRVTEQGLYTESNFETRVAENFYINNIRFYKALTPIDIYNHWTPDFIIPDYREGYRRQIIIEVFGMKDFKYLEQKESKIELGSKFNNNNIFYLFNSIDSPLQINSFIMDTKKLMQEKYDRRFR